MAQERLWSSTYAHAWAAPRKRGSAHPANEVLTPQMAQERLWSSTYAHAWAAPRKRGSAHPAKQAPAGYV